MKHVAFFGDGEKTFALTPPMVRELEQQAGIGIGALITRVIASNFYFGDLLQTIRLGLIGGGATPQEAAELVATYGEQRPFAETLPIAIGILEAAYFGEAPATTEIPQDDADV